MPPRTQPQISKDAGRQAVQRIADRRRLAGDPDLERIDADDPLDVLSHVLTRQRVLPEVLAEDVIDALYVLGYVRCHVPAVPSQLDDMEHRLLELGLRLKIPQIRLAGPLGLRSAQAVDHRIRRERAARQGLPRSERAERAARLHSGPRHSGRELTWYDRNALPLWESAAELAAHRRTRDLPIDDELAEELTVLHRQVGDVPWPLTAGSIGPLRTMAAQVRLILRDLEGSEYAPFRRRLGDLLPRLSRLATAQRAAQYGD